MKAIVTSFLFLISSVLYSQNDFLPANSSITWTGRTIVWVDSFWSEFYTDSVNNDTTINTLKYTKLNDVTGYHSAFRSDTVNQSIYFMPKDSIQEYLFFDYSVDYEVGNVVFIPHYMQEGNGLGGCYFTLSELDSVLIQNEYIQRWNFNKLDSIDTQTEQYPGINAENIVVMERMICDGFPFYGKYEFETFYELRCYSENSVSVWPTDCAYPYYSGTSDLDDAKQKNLSVSPNPNNGGFVVNYPFNEITQIFVYDSQGVLVHSGDIENQNQKIVLDDLPSGIYMVYLDVVDNILKTKMLID